MIRQKLIALITGNINFGHHRPKDNSPAAVMEAMRKAGTRENWSTGLLHYLFYLEMEPRTQPQSEQAIAAQALLLRRLAVTAYREQYHEIAGLICLQDTPSEQLRNLDILRSGISPALATDLEQIIRGPEIPVLAMASVEESAKATATTNQLVELLLARFKLTIPANRPQEILSALHEEVEYATDQDELALVYFAQYLFFVRQEAPPVFAHMVREQIAFNRRMAVRICGQMEDRITGGRKPVREDMTPAQQLQNLIAARDTYAQDARPLNSIVLRLLPHILSDDP
jgi:hypothetical protein